MAIGCFAKVEGESPMQRIPYGEGGFISISQKASHAIDSAEAWVNLELALKELCSK